VKLRDEENEHGTPVSVFRCEYCGRKFTVTPAVPDINADNWKGCLAPGCASYDESRDVDKMLEEGTAVIRKRTIH